MPAWWVHAHQVSKTAEAGGLLPAGDFLVKGEKNFLAPSQLVLGFAVMFQISKESLKNHKLHRFDVTETTESTAQGDGVAASAEEVKQTPEQANETAPANEPSETLNKQEEGEQSSDSDDEQEDPDAVPARNPLQRGDSESMPEEPVDEVKGADRAADKPTADSQEAEEELSEEETAPAEEDSPTVQTQEKEHLSAKEKRLAKQGKSLDSETDEKGSKQTSSPATNGKRSKGDTKSAPASSRGKKGKAKKAAAKYADQDEEERELALRLLGANKAKAEKAAAAAEAKANREREAEAQRKRRQAQHARAAEAERKRQALFEEGGGDDYDEETAAAEAADLEWIPALVGTPHPDDEILAAIPVCAPWGSLGRYKYRVKLQPGAVKKGKAVKEILGRWIAETTTGKVKKEHAEDAGISRAVAEKIRAREGELIKGWKDTEIINNVPVGKVRVMTGAGGSGGAEGKGKGKGGGGNKGGKGGKKK
jgi:hypothetical protein